MKISIAQIKNQWMMNFARTSDRQSVSDVLFITLIKTNGSVFSLPLKFAVIFLVLKGNRSGGNKEKTLCRSLRGSGTNASWNICLSPHRIWSYITWMGELCSIAFDPDEKVLHKVEPTPAPLNDGIRVFECSCRELTLCLFTANESGREERLTWSFAGLPSARDRREFSRLRRILKCQLKIQVSKLYNFHHLPLRHLGVICF